MRTLARAITVALVAAVAPALAGDATVKGRVTGHDGAPVAGVVVGLAGPSVPAPADAAHVLMDQHRNEFVPHTLAVAVGTTVDFPNHDPRLHNVYSASAAKKFDLGMYGEGQSKSVTFDQPGVVRIRCNVHPTMEGFVVVRPNPYGAVSAKDGTYTIAGVPPGDYTVEVWHERFTPPAPIPLKLGDGQVRALDLRVGPAR
jgi:plastocyanin